MDHTAPHGRGVGGAVHPRNRLQQERHPPRQNREGDLERNHLWRRDMGCLRPLVAALLAAVPFLFLGQHFNRQHRRGLEWSFLQIPLAFTVLLWIGLYLWSIIDAWRDAVSAMGQVQDQS